MEEKHRKSRESQEGRNFEAILYPDALVYDCQFTINRLASFWHDFYYILHDKDFYTEIDVDKWTLENDGKACHFQVGELKKPHYHIIGCTENNPIILATAARKFGVAPNHVQRVKNLKGSVQYLIHKNNPEKFQYSPDDVVTNNIEKFSKLIKSDMDATDKAKILVDFIFSGSCGNISQLATFALSNNCWDELRRGQHIYTSLINERRLSK